MAGDPVLHVLAGPNGAGKSTFYDRVLRPTTHLPFVNADMIAADRWPDDAAVHAYEAAEIASQVRDGLVAERRSFVAETVFSHDSKVDFVRRARAAGYQVTLHVLLVPEEEREAAEHEQQPADVSLVVQLLVQLFRTLRVAA